MHWLEHRIPPPIVAALIALLAWWWAPAEARTDATSALRLSLGFGIALLGGVVAGAGSRGFRRAKTTVNPLRPEKASALVTTGIYARTRNPMYVGMTLVLVGVAAWLWWWPALLAPVVYVAYITHFQIRPEERALQRKFGAEFDAYTRRVRRWL